MIKCPLCSGKMAKERQTCVKCWRKHELKKVTIDLDYDSDKIHNYIVNLSRKKKLELI
jgi:DNA-directed RNA polymerase subunit RPC12/RpoP